MGTNGVVIWNYSVQCDISIQFSAVCSGSVLRIMYVCEHIIMAIIYILISSLDDGSSGLAFQTQLQYASFFFFFFFEFMLIVHTSRLRTGVVLLGLLR